MAAIIRMPGVLAGSNEAALAGWLVAVGDRVAVGDPIAEIETDKATVEYAAEADGIVGRMLISAGDSSEVGSAIAVLIADGETDADIDAVLRQGDGPASPAGPELRDPESAAPNSDAPSIEAVAEAVTKALSQRAALVEQDGKPIDEAEHPVGSSRVFVSPLARRLAREKGIDLTAVRGTGPGGRIVRRDLESHVAAQPSPPAASDVIASASAEQPKGAVALPSDAVSDPSDCDEIPHTSMRRAIARRLTESKATVPHFYLDAECRVDALLALREQINESSPVRISINDFVVKAVAAAYSDVPEANVTWTEAAMRGHRTVDIAVAVATEGGLLTPVVHDVASKSLSAVSMSITELADRARSKKVRQDELEGGSFAVTNLGMYGILGFSAILNPPQSGILAVGAAIQQPVVTEGKLAVATVMRCTLSVDHRAVDGALAAQWLAAFQHRIENPLTILV